MESDKPLFQVEKTMAYKSKVFLDAPTLYR
jgi:hypothetical protein